MVRPLPIHVANKIAAGEVVERPASVVKELVENSIDAGAKNIKISVFKAGAKAIIIQDDGSGMSREDALMSLERHATSKIHDVGDIENIDTLGFRGEAIPSIASISRFSMTTRTKDADEGVRLIVNAGVLDAIETAGAPPGTLTEVRDLFCNVPVRRKFLRSIVTEENHIRNVFTLAALAHCAIAFSLFFDGREVYRLSSASSPKERIKELFGEAFMDSMNEIDYVGDEVSVSGFIEHPNLSMPTRKDQYVFINGRPASAPCIAYALREAYPRRQGDIRPAAILFISLPPSHVDVNVHPAKREVRFRNSTAVRLALIEAIKEATSPVPTSLQISSQTYEIASDASNSQVNNVASIPVAIQKQTFLAPQSPSAPQPQPQIAPQPQPQPQPAPQPQSQPAPQPVQQSLSFSNPLSNPRSSWTWFKFLAFTDSGYLLLETDSGIVTLNPRAARERISFEKLLLRQGKDRNPSQLLLIPEMVQLPPAAYHRVEGALDELTAMGFKIEAFGNDTFKIDAVPEIVGNNSVFDILSTIALDLENGSPGRTGNVKWREELIAKAIARSYSGTRIVLDEKSATALVEELLRCRMPYVCPRGKAVMFLTSIRELERKFGM